MNLGWNEFSAYIISQKTKRILAVFAIYLSIAGLITFSQFILEEAFQTTMFGTWPAQDAKRWDIVLDGTDLMEKITTTMKIVNYSVGWIQPLAFISYGAYAKSADFYIKALRSKVLAYAPELMEGREVEFEFIVKSIRKNGDKFIVSNGRIVFQSDKRLSGTVKIKGILKKTEVGYELIRIPNGDVP